VIVAKSDARRNDRLRHRTQKSRECLRFSAGIEASTHPSASLPSLFVSLTGPRLGADTATQFRDQGLLPENGQ
jgi:hypothetical protein